MKRFIAFTLAEVLVTLGIIGVVSAMTIPTLMRNHQKQVYVVQLKKAYSVLAQGLQYAIDKDNAVSLSESKAFDNGAKGFISSNFKTAQVCDQADAPNCMAEKYRNLYGEEQEIIFDDGDFTCGALADGITFCIKPQFPDSSPVYVDINGKEGPNVLGRDLFLLVAKNSGDLVGSREDEDGYFYEDTGSAYGVFFSRILRDGWKMDY